MDKTPIYFDTSRELLERVSLIGIQNPTRDIIFYFYGIDSIRVGCKITPLNVHIRRLEKVHQVLPLDRDAITVIGLFEELQDEEWFFSNMKERDSILILKNRSKVFSLLKPYTHIKGGFL